MSKNNSDLSRREVMVKTGQVAAATALAGVVLPQVHAQGNDLIKVALVGCGGRGTGAALDALYTTGGQIQLVAMADVFQDRLNSSYNTLHNGPRATQVDVPQARRFVGFDAYRHAMDALREGDVVILATPPAFRWPHFTYAIQKRLNVFMEKPVTVDAGSSQRMLALAAQSEQLGLKVGVGLMCRHCVVRQELFNRIRDGAIGNITMLRAYRMHGPVGSAFVEPRPANSSMNELMYQIRNFHGFLWASGGCYSDFYIHNIDECCWIKDAWPIQAKACGGRHYRGNYVDQNFDSYSVEYTFPDGTKLFLEGRTMEGCHQEFASYAHGTTGCATISYSGHSPCHSRIFSGHHISSSNSAPNLVWRWSAAEPNPYRVEWQDLMNAIRNNQPYNEVRRGVEASLVTAMGRIAAHTGQVVTRQQVISPTQNHQFEIAPQVDQLTLTSAAPVQADGNGRYPVPQPGIVNDREYQVGNG
jgi:predicted dehydrogenase